MKRILYSVAMVAMVAGTLFAGAAQAAGSCEQNLKEVKVAWQNHLDMSKHPGGSGAGGQQTTATIKSVIEHGEKDCVAGKNNEANENLALARRHMSIKEFKEGK